MKKKIIHQADRDAANEDGESLYIFDVLEMFWVDWSWYKGSWVCRIYSMCT